MATLHNCINTHKQRRGVGLFGIFLAIAIGLTITGIMLSINASVLTEIRGELPAVVDDNTTDSYVPPNYAENITNKSLEAANTASGWLNIYTIVAIAAAIMALVFGFAAIGTRRSGGGGKMRGSRF